MSSITETITGHCYHCGKNTEWIAEMIFLHKQRTIVNRSDYSKVEKYFTIESAVKCTECGEIVPFSQWKRYSKSGKIVNYMDA